MAKQQHADAPAIRTREHFPFLSSGGTTFDGLALAVRPGVPVRALLEHATYILTAADIFIDGISTDAVNVAKVHDAATGVQYLVQLAHGMVNAATETLAADGGEA